MNRFWNGIAQVELEPEITVRSTSVRPRAKDISAELTRSTLERQNSMSTKPAMAAGASADSRKTEALLKQYGCGPIRFMRTDGLYERHLHFDNVIAEDAIGLRERF